MTRQSEREQADALFFFASRRVQFAVLAAGAAARQ
jgi:hypothetical protein